MMNRKGKWEGCSLRAHFHRARDVWVRGSIAVKEASARRVASHLWNRCSNYTPYILCGHSFTNNEDDFNLSIDCYS